MVSTNLLETVVSVPALVVIVVARVAPDLSSIAFLKYTFSTKLKFNEKAASPTKRANDNDTMIQGSKSQPPEPEPDPAEVWRFTGSCLLSGILSRKVKVKLLLTVVSILLQV